MNVLVVLQSRLCSSRLPGKALLTIGGLPMVVLAARRAASTGLCVVVAIGDESSDDPLSAALRGYDVPLMRGPLHDPLARFEQAAAGLAPDDVVVRLTGDNVVPNGALLDGLLAHRRRTGANYVRMDDRLPHGLGAEAFSAGLLRAAAASAVAGHDREHVTPWMRRHGVEAQFRPDGVPTAWSRLRCTVDRLDDFHQAVAVVSAEADPLTVGWRALLQRWAESQRTAAHVEPRRPNPIGQGPLVLGTAQLGMAYGAANPGGLPDDAAAADVLRVAAVCGVSHVDTARAYGSGERRIGDAGGPAPRAPGEQRARSGLRRPMGVVTKLAPLDHLSPHASARRARAAVEDSVAASLSELRATRVDALLVHRWTDWSKSGGAVADRLTELRTAKVTTLLGASVSTPDELVEALSEPRVAYVQMPFNLLDRRWLSVRVSEALARRPDVVVTARSVFLQGLLVAGDRARWPGVAEAGGMDVPGTLKTLHELTHDLDRDSVADLCMAYVLGHAFVTSVVLGAETPEQVREQAALVRRRPLTGAQISTVRQRLPAGPEALVDPSRWDADG